MNERIRDLYEQACDIERENELATKPYKDRVVIKFAELIVKECIETMYNTEQINVAKFVALTLQEHFEVEE